MIKVNKYEAQIIEHFDAEGNSLGFLNELENADLRCQIAEQKVCGYYLVFNNKRVDIQSNGRLIWEEDLYDTNSNLLARLFKAQR